LRLKKCLASLGLRAELGPQLRLAGAQANGVAVSARRRILDLNADLVAVRVARSGCLVAAEALFSSFRDLCKAVLNGMPPAEAVTAAISLFSSLNSSISVRDRKGQDLLSGAYEITKFGGESGAVLGKVSFTTLGTDLGLGGFGVAICARALMKAVGAYDPAISLNNVWLAACALTSAAALGAPGHLLDPGTPLALANAFGPAGTGIGVPSNAPGVGASPLAMFQHDFAATEGGDADLASALQCQTAFLAAGMDSAWFAQLGFFRNSMDNTGRFGGGGILATDAISGTLLEGGFRLDSETLGGIFRVASLGEVGARFCSQLLSELVNLFVVPCCMGCSSAFDGLMLELGCVHKTETLNRGFYDDSVAASPEVIATSLQTAKNTFDETLRLLTIILQQLKEQSHAVDRMI
jgi:hypothetical protein